MSAKELRCPDCGGEMREGFVPEVSGAFANWKQQEMWVEGAHELWTSGNLKTDRTQFPVTSYRCDSCGLLKFYARSY